MARKGNRLREFEKNHRVLDITGAQEERQKKKSNRKKPAVETEKNAEEKKNTRTNWVKFTGITISIIFLLIVGMSVKNIYDLRGREAALQEENEKLQQIKEELNIELENVNSEEYIEEQARQELKLIKANELIFYFPENFQIKKESSEENKDNTNDGE